MQLPRLETTPPVGGFEPALSKQEPTLEDTGMTRFCELTVTGKPHSSGSWQAVVSQMASPGPQPQSSLLMNSHLTQTSAVIQSCDSWTKDWKLSASFVLGCVLIVNSVKIAWKTSVERWKTPRNRSLTSCSAVAVQTRVGVGPHSSTGCEHINPPQRRHKGLRPPRLKGILCSNNIIMLKPSVLKKKKIDGKILPRILQLPIYGEEKSQSLNHSSDGTITLMQN